MQPGEVTLLKTGTRLRRLSVNVWKFDRTTALPESSLSGFKSCAEIVPARIGPVFGSSWRNRELYGVSARRQEFLSGNQEPRNCCGGVRANAWRLAETPTVCDETADATTARETTDSPITLEIDLWARP